MKVLILLAAVALSTALPLADEWEDFKKTFSKSYETELEELHRNTIWQANKKFIESHNANSDKFGFTLKMNHLGDLENHEINELLNQYKVQNSTVTNNNLFKADPNFVPAKTVDWRDKGAVTEVKNQGQCGSCWSFSATGSLEGQHFLKKGTLVSLSEQNLVDCSVKYGNHGCKGGLMDLAFKYIKANGGIDTEESYPYQAHDETCRFKPADVGATLSGYTDIPHGEELALTQAIQTVGPISVAMDASKSTFHFYHAGIYSDPTCSSTHLDHGVLAVGFGTDLGDDYYIVKNSWGALWGMDGYFLSARNSGNMCGLATQASYPLVEE